MTRVGTVVSVADVSLAESVAGAFDVVWIDLEHGALTVADVQPLAIAVQSAGCEAHVRVPRWDSELLPAIIDAGVDGVVAPRVESASDAAAFADRLHYPPHGNRGFGPRRAGRHGRDGDPPPVRCSVQIESANGVDQAPAIARVDGVEALVVGCADLAITLGVRGELDAPELGEAVRRTAAAASTAGAEFGIAAAGPAAAVAALASPRPDLVVFSVDVRLYARAVDAAAEALLAALGGTHAAA
jgi:4-hydroxy-2-oxoheptanedioate aldolase